MVCMPGFIWGQKGVEAYKWRYTREGPTFWERKRTRVSCEEYRGAMVESSLRHHMERSHGILLNHIRGVDVGGRGPETYKVSFSRVLMSVECPLEV